MERVVYGHGKSTCITRFEPILNTAKIHNDFGVVYTGNMSIENENLSEITDNELSQTMEFEAIENGNQTLDRLAEFVTPKK